MPAIRVAPESVSSTAEKRSVGETRRATSVRDKKAVAIDRGGNCLIGEIENFAVNVPLPSLCGESPKKETRIKPVNAGHANVYEMNSSFRHPRFQTPGPFILLGKSRWA